jgi:hypothetical protein
MLIFSQDGRFLFYKTHLIAFGMVSLIACRPKEIELPFQTIERRQTAGTGEIWEPREPGLMIIASRDDLVKINDLFTKGAQTRLNDLDFETSFAIAAFLGWQPRGHEGLEIIRLTYKNDEVKVFARVGNPSTEDAVTSPYHLIIVRKDTEWNRKISFTLYLNNIPALSLSHFIP